MVTPRLIGAEWLGRGWECACGATHRIPTVQAIVDDAAAARAAAWLAGHAPGRVAVVADSTTWEVAGRDTASAIAAEPGMTAAEIVIEPARHPDRRHADRVAERAAGAAALVAVGSGTINDFTKAAAERLARPYVCVATAASMNGYTSPIAALMVDGLKSTLPCAPPQAVYAAPRVLAGAPHSLTASGFADLLSKTASESDWLLAHHLIDERHCREPGRVVGDAVAAVIESAAAIGRDDPAAVAALFEALVLSGFAMTIAGGSAPASGGEHLVSHYWDMRIPKEDPLRRLHGLQVGVGTLAALAVYESLAERFARGTPTAVDPGRWDPMATAIAEHFGPLATVVLPEAEAKYRRTIGDPGWRDRFPTRATAAMAAAVPGLLRRDRLDALLAAAGAARTPADLGLTDEDLAAAIEFSRHIRDRFTVFDLAAAIGRPA